MKFKSIINWNKMMIVFGVSFILMIILVVLTRNMDITMFGTEISLAWFVAIDYFLLFSIYVLLFDDFYKLNKEGVEIYHWVFFKKFVSYCDIKAIKIEEKATFFTTKKKDIVVLELEEENKSVKLTPEHIKMFVGVIKEEMEKVK